MASRKRTPGYIWLLFGGWCLALTLLLYGAALQLPFFFDDFVHVPFVDGNSLAEMWRSAGRLAYYRPLPFTIWKIMYLISGQHQSTLQHGFNLFLHFLNGFLVGWLAGQFWNNESLGERRSAAILIGWPRAYLAATLFLVFPFSYQAVPWVGSLAHLLVTALILLSLSAYWRMRQSGSRVWGAASLFLALLAPFAHENGALVGPLLGAMLFSQPDFRRHIGRNVRHVVLWTLPALIWLPIWWFAPKGISGGVGLRGLEAILQNIAYFAQGAFYPLTWLGGRIRTVTAANDMVITGVLSLLALVGAAAIQLLGKADRRSLLPWLWMAIASLPAVLFLSFDYVINGPRLLMLVAVGAAWLWTDVILVAIRWLGLVDRRSVRKRWPVLVLVGVVLSLLLVQNAAFIGRRMQMHQILGETYRQATALVLQANEAGQPAIFVNLPAWLAPESATFALGHEGVQFWPDYAPPDTLASVNHGRQASLILSRYDAIRPEMPYHYGLTGKVADWVILAEAAGRVFVADYEPDAIQVRAVGDLDPPQEPGHPLASFESPDGTARVALTTARAKRSGSGLDITLGWQVEALPAEHVTAFVHIVDGQGRLVDQLDGDPLVGAFPFYQWPVGLHVAEHRTGAVEGDELTVLVGLYDRLTQQRFSALAANGAAWDDGAVPIPVE